MGKKHYTTNESIIRLSTALHVELSPNEVFFAEDGYDEATNEFIKENFVLISQCFAKHGLQFIYLPTLVEQLMSDERLLRYRQPVGELPEPEQAPGLTSTALLYWMAYPENRPKVAAPGLVAAVHRALDDIPLGENEMQLLARVDFRVDECDDLPRYLDYLIEVLHEAQRRKLQYHLVPQTPDETFEEDTHTLHLLQEVQKLLNELRARGVSDHILRLCIDKPSPSQLTITRDHRIYLSDFNNMEIRMTPLVKAVFFLFLRHPDGILFKELVDYRDELAMLYSCIKERRPIEERVMSLKHYDKRIVRLTDPLDNSLNEKCARIKEAFLIHVHDDIACHYYVKGRRGEPKAITLDRNLLRWE